MADAESISRKVLLVGVDEPLLPELATSLERRATPCARVTLTELTDRGAEDVAALVLSSGAARVSQPRMLKSFVEAGRSIIVLAREAAAADQLRTRLKSAVMHLSPADGANDVASQIVDILHPDADISNSETVRPPPGVLPEEVEKEMSGPHRHAEVAAAEEAAGGTRTPMGTRPWGYQAPAAPAEAKPKGYQPPAPAARGAKAKPKLSTGTRPGGLEPPEPAKPAPGAKPSTGTRPGGLEPPPGLGGQAPGAPARERTASGNEVFELESDLLESVHPSEAPVGVSAEAPPLPPAPAAPIPPAAAHGTPPAPPSAAGPPPSAATTASPPSPQPAPGPPPPQVGVPTRVAPKRSGGAGRLVAVGLLVVGVVAVLGVGALILLGGEPEPEVTAPPAGEPTTPQEPQPSPEAEPDYADPSTATGPGTAEAMEGAGDTAEGEAAGEEPATEEPTAPAPTAGGTPEERIAAAREAEVERAPGESDRQVIHARQQIQDGDLAAAAASLSRALELDPDNPRAYAWMGRLHTARGEGERAVQWLELAVDRRPRRSEYRLWLGDAQKAAGDVDAARRTWFRVRRDEGDTRELRERLQSL